MNLKKMWPAAAVSLFALTSLAHANEAKSQAVGMAMPHQSTVDRLEKKGANPFSLSAELLYWDASQDHMGYAVNAQNNFTNAPANANSLTSTATFRTAKIPFKPGFRLGLHTRLERHDQFDVAVLWTYHGAKHQDITKNNANENLFFVDAPLVVGFPFNLDSNNAPKQSALNNQAKSWWQLRTNFADLEIGRSFKASNELSLRPHGGLRYVKIDQQRKLQLDAVISGTTGTFSNGDHSLYSNHDLKFQGLGLRFGFDTFWHLGRDVSLFAKAAISFVGGEFEQTVKEFTDSEDADTLILKGKEISGKAIGDLHYGLMFEKMSSDNSLGIVFTLGWEQHMLWGQNQTFRIDNKNNFTSTTNPVLKLQKNGDLFLRGLTASFKFTF